MYQEVVLPQPYRTQLPGKLAPSSLTCFLRTMLKRPELGARVSKLAVWVWKGKLIRSSVDPKKESFCACGTCMKALSPLVDRLKLSSIPLSPWTRDLSGPTEAAVRALIFTSLPNLKTLELSAKSLPIRKDEASELLARFQKSNLLDVSRLAHGLPITSVTTLTLSANLNGISVARLPAVTTLTLDYSESDPFVTVCKGHFANVTTLKIQTEPDGENQSRYTEKLDTLFRGLPKVTSIEFASPSAATFCTLPQHMQALSFQDAHYGTLDWLHNHLSDRKTLPSALRCIDMHWLGDMYKPDDSSDKWAGIRQLAMDADIKVNVWWHGELVQVFE
jgi:hypothetical protein